MKLFIGIIAAAILIALLIGGLYSIGDGLTTYSTSQTMQAIEQTKQVQLQTSADIQKQQDYLAYMATLVALDDNTSATKTDGLLQTLTTVIWTAVSVLAGMVTLEKRKAKLVWPYNKTAVDSGNRMAANTISVNDNTAHVPSEQVWNKIVGNSSDV